MQRLVSLTVKIEHIGHDLSYLVIFDQMSYKETKYFQVDFSFPIVSCAIAKLKYLCLPHI